MRYTDKILIIYLKGRKRTWKDKTVRFMPVDDLHHELDSKGAANLVWRIQFLKRGILRPEKKYDLLKFITNVEPNDRDEILSLLDINVL